jgi:hypothetical protein
MSTGDARVPDIGAPRSVMNTNLLPPSSRLSARNMRNSSPPICCTDGMPFLETAHVHHALREIKLIPRDRAELRHAQTMPVRDHDHRRVAQAVPSVAIFRARDEALHFPSVYLFSHNHPCTN